MSRVTIRHARKTDGDVLLALIDALAGFEKLRKPTSLARKRLLRDAFGPKPRFEAMLACVDRIPVGYAIIFETYSSFLALPTLYLEDIFVLPAYRHQGIGLKLFKRCVYEAKRRGCGRMEWAVLDWNKTAIRFYRKLNARQMKEWLFFRLEFTR